MKKFLLFTLLIWQGFILSANDSTWYTLTDADIVMDGNGEILQYTPVTSDRHIIIPDTLHGQAVVSIRDGIFENGMYRGVFQYKSITGVQFPSTLKKIGTYAFDLGQITELHIPEGVEYIGRNAFDSQKIIKLSLPSTLKHLGGSAFTENKIDTFNFWPPLLDTIPNAAFSKNPNLKVVNIPAHVTFIAGGVFWNCDSLSVINFESGSKLKHIGVRAFRGCAIDQLDLPQEIDTIDEEAFYRNPMSDLQLPMGLRYIGRRCFNENNIKRLNVPATIEHFGLDCFSENDINEVNLAEGLKETGSYALNNISSIIVPDGIEELSPSAFAGNPLTSLVLPDSMRVLGEGALSDTYLSQIPIPPLVQEIPKDYCDNTLVENMFIPARIKSIGNYAFNGCARLQSIEFENGSACTTLGDGVFKDCTALDSITLPDSLEYLGKGAFKGCASLVNIELPHKIQSIRAETFSGCTNIAKFNFGGVKKIYKKAFYKSGIKELTIPKSIEAIYSQAFAYSNIDSLHITAGVDIGYSAFGFCELEKVSFDPECTTVNGLDNNNLKSVNLPDSVKTIESRAFYQNNLTEIDLKNVEIIHNQAFAGNKLDTVILPETISFIKKYAFDANYITSFQLPGNGQWLSSSG
ncbi:MAG: leucine-rich repeat domain-containing protein, partial [bacterium]